MTTGMALAVARGAVGVTLTSVTGHMTMGMSLTVAGDAVDSLTLTHRSHDHGDVPDRGPRRHQFDLDLCDRSHDHGDVPDRGPRRRQRECAVLHLAA